MHRAHRRLRRLLASSSMAALCLALPWGTACHHEKGTNAPDTAKPSADPTPKTSDTDPGPAAEDACRSWSDLDLSTLPPLPETPYTATLEQVWTTILQKHYDPTLGCLDWPAVRMEYGGKLAEAKDDDAAYAVISEMLHRLGQSHLAVIPPRKEVAGEPRAAVKSGSARVPIDVRMIGREPVVVNPRLDGHKSGIPGGAVIVAIDDYELAPTIEQAYERFGKREVEASFAVRRAVTSHLSCPEGASKTIRFHPFGADAAAGKPKSKKVKCKPLQAERVSLGNLKNVPAEVEHRMLPSKNGDTKIGYIRFNIWMIPLVAKVEAAMAELREQGMTALVLDLRGNPGGVGAMVVPLGRMLLSEDADLGAMHMREATQTFNVTAGDDPFTGPMALLIDEGTASTSEIFGQALQDLGRAKVYGAVPSQGAALPSVIETLDGGGMLQYVVADYKSPKGILVEGKGVAPDVVVPETREDFAKGRDPVLEAAVADLGGT